MPCTGERLTGLNSVDLDEHMNLGCTALQLNFSAVAEDLADVHVCQWQCT